MYSYFSMSEWSDIAQKIENVAMLLHSGVQEKHMSKVTVAECNNKLEIQLAWPLIMSEVDELHKFWSKKEIAIPDNHSKIVGFHKVFRKIRNLTSFRSEQNFKH